MSPQSQGKKLPIPPLIRSVSPTPYPPTPLGPSRRHNGAKAPTSADAGTQTSRDSKDKIKRERDQSRAQLKQLRNGLVGILAANIP